MKNEEIDILIVKILRDEFETGTFYLSSLDVVQQGKAFCFRRFSGMSAFIMSWADYILWCLLVTHRAARL